MFNTQIDNSTVEAPKPFEQRPVLLPETSVEKVDFRRSEAGGGKLVVNFSDDGVTVDTRERDGEIVVDLLGATLPPSFCLLYTSPSPRDLSTSRMPSSA